MRTGYWLLFLLCVGGLMGGLAPVGAQPLDARSTIRTAGTTANLFATVDPGQSFHGVAIELPRSWNVEDVHLLRYGTEPVSFQRKTLDDGRVVLTTESPRQGPHELVLRLRLGDSTGHFQWHVTPFVQDSSGSPEKGRRLLSAHQKTREIDVEAPSRPEEANRVVDVSEAATPLLLPADSLPTLGRLQSFTIEFWMRTSGLNEVILSTWNGNENVAYSAEFTIDRSGRLRYYSGQPGQHQALRTKAPVADDQWHHVALTYDASASQLRLLLDGTVADSGPPRALPQAPGPVPLALGGRVSARVDTASAPPTFSGRLDEVRVWPEARSTDVLRSMRKRPYAAQAPEESEREPVRLSFDAETEKAAGWPEGLRHVPSTLSFHAALRNLRADTQGQTVILRWEADPSSEGAFVVERSAAGRDFVPIVRLQPSEATRSPSDRTKFVYRDENVKEQVVYYRIRRVEETEGIEQTSGTIKIGLGPAKESSGTELLGNFPNPFSESTTIAYEVHEATPVTLTVWNLAGHRVATLADGTHEPGYHEKVLDAEDLPSGTYFARLQTPDDRHSHRMVVLR